MRMFPPYIRDTGSNAEGRLFRLLSDLEYSSEWMAFHSLNLSRHQYKKWAELDFVLVGPQGLYVLEVKGGGVSCNDGVWIFVDRYGEQHRRLEGPFDQARTGMFSLLSFMKEALSRPLIDRLASGWGVVFPDIRFKPVGPEMPKEVICDSLVFNGQRDFQRYLNGLVGYWRAKRGGNQDSRLDSSDLRKIRDYLRPSFDVVPSLASRADDVEREIVSLTDEQYRYLDAVDTAPRILCSGGAGTGKTFLAIEVARRELAAGNRVLVAARGDVFTAYLSSRLNIENVFVASRRELPSLVGRTSTFDVLIVDEGQDLMSLDDLELFEQLLIGGMERGRWRWFYDENNQSAIYENWEDEAHEYLLSTNAVPMKLRHNCRNTEDIVFQTQLVTGAHLGETDVRGRGIPVIFDKVDGRESATKALDKQLSDWMEQGVRLDDISILSPCLYDQSCVSALPRRWLKKLIRYESSLVHRKINEEGLVFSSVRDFKGLERRFVAVVDTKELGDDEKSISTLYVAMTRAHAGLWMAVDGEFGKILDRLRQVHLKAMLQGTEGGVDE